MAVLRGFIGRYLAARLTDPGAPVRVVRVSGPGSGGEVKRAPCGVGDSACLRGAAIHRLPASRRRGLG